MEKLKVEFYKTTSNFIAMDLPETWKNYKSLLALDKNNNGTSVKDFLSRLCSPLENLTNSTKLAQLFTLAVELKNCEIVSWLLQHGVRGKPCEELFKYTPVQRAVISGYGTLILEMAQCGVAYDEVDNEGNTLLHLAVVNKNERWKYVDISHSRSLLKCQTQELIYDTLKVLLNLGLNVNAVNKKGESPLSFAVKYRLKKVTELFVEHNASLNVFDKSVSHYLIMDEIETFRRKENESKPSEYDGLWMEMQKQDFMEWWFSKKLDIDRRSNFETPLQLCARYNMKDLLQLLLKYTSEINVVDAVGRTLLHILIGSLENSSKIKSQKCEFKETIEMVKLLMEKGISVDETDKCGNTPFHVAARLKRPEMMQTIIERFTNVNSCNNMRETALHVVVKNCSDEYYKEYLEIVGELVRKGTDFDLQDRCGNTPLHCACLKSTKASKKIVKLLVRQGCNVNVKNEKGVTPLYLSIQMKNEKIIETLMNNGAEVNYCEKTTNSTPLHVATKKNLPSVVESLLKAGAKPDIRDTLKQTPLHIAVSDCYLSPAMMSLLLMFGADVEVLDNDKKTPLHRAFDANVYKRVEMLLNFGAKIHIHRSQLTPSKPESTTYNPKTLLIKHLVARSMAGLFVRDYYKVVVQRAQRDFAAFHEQCAQELESMKITTIDDVSVYDLIRMSIKRRFAYMMKDAFKGFVTDYEYLKDKFPAYRHVISASYWTAVKRKPLMDSAKVAWYELASVSLPEMCVELILGYLENSDLKFLIEAGN